MKAKKFEIEDHRGYIEPSYDLKGEQPFELPEEYGDTGITLLVQDPYWAFAYWEINEATRKKFNIPKGSHERKMAIRVYDSLTKQHQDILVQDHAKSWYFQIPEPNKSYYSEIGVFDQNGQFQLIARSNMIHVPTDKPALSPSFKSEEARSKSEALFRQSGGYVVNRLVGSQTVSEWGAAPTGMSSGSGGISSGSGGMGVAQPATQKGFWAELHTELIVYGATDPKARVTIGGQPIQLSPDGKFSIRFYLKDGQHPIPFTAVSADGLDSISITPFVSQQTTRKDSRRKP